MSFFPRLRALSLIAGLLTLPACDAVDSSASDTAETALPISAVGPQTAQSGDDEAEDSILDYRVEVSPRTTFVNGEEGRAHAQFSVFEDGRGAGTIHARTEDVIYRWTVEGGAATCSDGPVGGTVEGTVLVVEPGAGPPRRESFVGVVRPDPDVEDCLIFDLSSGGVSPDGAGETAQFEIEGDLAFSPTACG